MAEWPANADTDWNTKMLAYLAIEHETDGTHQEDTTYSLVDAVKTKVFTKYFTGTTDADAATEIAHGIADIDKILHVSASIFNGSFYEVSDFRGQATSATLFMDILYDGTNVLLQHGTTLQSQKYRIKIDYIV